MFYVHGSEVLDLDLMVWGLGIMVWGSDLALAMHEIHRHPCSSTSDLRSRTSGSMVWDPPNGPFEDPPNGPSEDMAQTLGSRDPEVLTYC